MDGPIAARRPPQVTLCLTRMTCGPETQSGNMAPDSNTGQMMARVCISRHGKRTPQASSSSLVSLPQLILPGGINVACCDGHVEYSPLNNLWNYYWHALSVPKGMP